MTIPMLIYRGYHPYLSFLFIAAIITGGPVLNPTPDSTAVSNLGLHIPSANREEDEVVSIQYVLFDHFVARSHDLH